ncbi:MAG: tetratricopeptide repeat protein, partial [Actinomycetia bacterium]|nr:tetratricopeptide repeat protein [Actinomycetes bacterium]
TVFTELDRLKLSHPDRDLKFRGRKVARLLFDIGQTGKLLEGIKLENGSVFRVVNFNREKPYPHILNIKTSDDQILATTSQIKEENPRSELILITNDLNMLLKAQSLEIGIKRFSQEERRKDIFTKRLGKYTNLINLLGLTAIIFILLFTAWRVFVSLSEQEEKLPPQLMAEHEAFKIQEQEYLKILEERPEDIEASIGAGNLYFDAQYYQSSIDMYKKVLQVNPQNTDVRTDMAIAYYQIGLKDIALKELLQVIEIDPNHAYSHYNLGIIYWKGFNNLNDSLTNFSKYLELEPEGKLHAQANIFIKEINEALGKGDKNSE